MTWRSFLPGLLALLIVAVPADARRKPKVVPKVKVSCVGNSITYGMRLDNRDEESYPVQLQRMLGDKYEVGNFGKSGATLLRHGHRPYFEQEEFRQAMDFAGDIVVIHLGINDTDPRNWPHFQDEFVGDYLALIDSLRSVNPKARFLIARMTPIGSNHTRFISGTKTWHGQIQKAIETVAQASGAELIDFYDPLYPYPWMFPDVGMAVTSDLGDPTDVHYREKKPVGERLALQALAKYYGHNVVADGPLPQGLTSYGSFLKVDFGAQTSLRTSDGGPVIGFEIQDAADGLYHPVEAKIDGNCIFLDCSALKHPRAVRYAWQPYTRANLVNTTGLPASTFRLPVE